MPHMLYYPTINPPPELLYKALLYWDKICTIVPPEGPEEYLNPLMRTVDDAQLYEPVVSPYGHGFLFEEAVHVLQYLVKAIPADDLIPPPKATTGSRPTVIVSKLGDDLSQWLIDQGWAEQHGPFELRVSPTLQLLVVGVAANALAAYASDVWVYENGRGRPRGIPVYPHTEQISAYRASHSAYPRVYGDEVRPDPVEGCWLIELGSCFLCPHLRRQSQT